jgi:hypothetical protein
MIKLKRLTLTVPPKRGPNPQGLNISYNTVRTVKSEKTTNAEIEKPIPTISKPLTPEQETELVFE